MKIKEIKKKTKDELIKDLDKFKKDLFNFRFQKINSQITNSSKINTIKKTLARIKTTIKNENMTKKILKGKVVKNNRNKTITVLVERKYQHPVLKKVIKTKKKYHAHDEKNLLKVGDKVSIIETNPISKQKKFKVLEVIQ